MIRCTMDMSVEENSKCAWCCIYCNEKEYCDYLCNIVKESNTELDILEKDCIHAYVKQLLILSKETR